MEQELIKIYANGEYGFGGNTKLWMVAATESPSRFTGNVVKNHHKNELGAEITIVKDNVAGWERHGAWPKGDA